jgi:outer membrane lipoprotein-sorting protein
MLQRFLCIAISIAAVLAPSAVLGETNAEKGLAIAQEMKKRDLGWRNSETTLAMVLENRHGQSSTRKLRTQTWEIEEPGLGDKSLTIFDHPKDIKGTAFLSHTKIRIPDDQWLYLPALKRVKRISSANKSGPFVGSEFAYEDLLSFEVERYTYTWLRDEPCGALQCFVNESIPVYENSGYTRQVVWIDQEEYRPMKIDFYDRKNALLKTLTYSQYHQYLDQYWRAHQFQMVNHQTGKNTTLTFHNYKFRIGLKESNFSPSRLKRVR